MPSHRLHPLQLAVAAVMLLGCRADVVVPSGVFACETSAECPAGMTCQGALCVDEDDPADAGVMNDADVMSDAGADAGDAGFDASVPDAGLECDPACEDPLVCVDGTCGCEDDWHCGREAFCNSGSCVDCIMSCEDGDFCTLQGCFACRRHLDCEASAGGESYCVSGECVGCRDEGDCPSDDAPYCIQGTCQECGANPECGGNTPICFEGSCVGCGTSADCSGTRNICSNHECVECVSRSQCRSDEACIDGDCR